MTDDALIKELEQLAWYRPDASELINRAIAQLQAPKETHTKVLSIIRDRYEYHAVQEILADGMDMSEPAAHHKGVYEEIKLIETIIGYALAGSVPKAEPVVCKESCTERYLRADVESAILAVQMHVPYPEKIASLLRGIIEPKAEEPSRAGNIQDELEDILFLHSAELEDLGQRTITELQAKDAKIAELEGENSTLGKCMNEFARELGCKPDNEEILASIAKLQSAEREALEKAVVAVEEERLHDPAEDDEADEAYNKAVEDCIYAIRALITAAPEPAKEPSQAARDVLAERQRQISVEGWTPEHDGLYVDGEMAAASACYALSGAKWTHKLITPLSVLFPWADKWWKPTTPRRDLVKAGALILAEIERLDRAAKPAGEKP